MKVGLIEYINSIPFRHNFPVDEFELITDVPARLAERFFAGELDAAMIPVVEYLKSGQNAVILPNFSISSMGPTNSVFLRISPENPENGGFLPSPESRSSNFYTQLLFPHLTETTDAENAHARVIIGDKALREKDAFCRDFGEIWHEQTGLPTVFAVLVAKDETTAKALIKKVLPKFSSNMTRLASILTELKQSTYLDYLNGLNYELSTPHFHTMANLRSQLDQPLFSDQDYFQGFLGSLAGIPLLDDYRQLTIDFAIKMTDSGQTWYLSLENCVLTKISREPHECKVIFELSAPVFGEMASGKLNPAQAFFQRKTEIKGHLYEGMKLAKILAVFFKKYPFSCHRVETRRNCHA